MKIYVIKYSGGQIGQTALIKGAFKTRQAAREAVAYLKNMSSRYYYEIVETELYEQFVCKSD